MFKIIGLKWSTYRQPNQTLFFGFIIGINIMLDYFISKHNVNKKILQEGVYKIIHKESYKSENYRLLIKNKRKIINV